jgi:hypothetical protein
VHCDDSGFVGYYKWRDKMSPEDRLRKQLLKAAAKKEFRKKVKHYKVIIFILGVILSALAGIYAVVSRYY